LAGVQSIDISLEFGGNLSVNLGVASGGVSIMAGIHLTLGSQDASVTAYIRLHGYLSILGLISLSLTFYLSLTYDFTTGNLIGQPTWPVEVEVFTFSKSFDIAVKKTFTSTGGVSPRLYHDAFREMVMGGGLAPPPPLPHPGPPRLTDLMSGAEW